MSKEQRLELDRATFCVFMKATLSWALVIKHGHSLKQEAKAELNHLVNTLQKFEKRLDNSVLPERLNGAQDLADNMGQFFEQWVMADQDEQNAIVELVRQIESKNQITTP